MRVASLGLIALSGIPHDCCDYKIVTSMAGFPTMLAYITFMTMDIIFYTKNLRSKSYKSSDVAWIR